MAVASPLLEKHGLRLDFYYSDWHNLPCDYSEKYWFADRSKKSQHTQAKGAGHQIERIELETHTSE